MLLPILGVVVAALGGLWYYEKHKKPAVPAGVTITTSLLTGHPYGLNLYMRGGYTPTQLLALLAAQGLTGVLRQPANVAANVAGSGYTFNATIDQWIAYVQATKNITLPMIMTLDGTTPEGVIKNAVDMSSMMPALPSQAMKISGMAESQMSRPVKLRTTFGTKFGYVIGADPRTPKVAPKVRKPNLPPSRSRPAG